MGLRCAWVIVLRLVLLWYIVFKVCDVVSAVAVSRLVVSHVVVSCVVVTSAVLRCCKCPYLLQAVHLPSECNLCKQDALSILDTAGMRLPCCSLTDAP